MMVQKSPCLRTYNRTDPAQSAFRDAVGQLGETELVDLENDLDAYARSGVLSSVLERFISNAGGSFRQAA